MRTLAVDWSGAARHAERHIWLAEAHLDDRTRLRRLEAGRGRDVLINHLLDEAQRDPHLVIGLDFAFAFPAWFSLGHLAAENMPDVWAQVARDGEAWLATCPPPFWGRLGRPRPVQAGPGLRWTEQTVPRVGAIGPKSVFQIGGAGAVGTGSLRGMPVLGRLARAGACVWPARAGGWPVVVEIYPRLLTGPVAKSDPLARQAYIDRHFPGCDPEHRRQVIASADAFDAAISALVMARHVLDLAALPPEPDALRRLEGRIWHPAWRQDGGPADLTEPEA